jgi:hypothetical protein
LGIVLLLLGAAGCPAFLSDDWHIVTSDATTTDDGGAGVVETGVPDAVDADAGADGDSVDVDASAADRGEASVAVDAPTDVTLMDVVADVLAHSLADGGTCTPFPDGSTIAAPAGCSSGLNLLPAPAYVWAVAPWGCSFGLGTTQSNTPVECQCQESYNCACIMAHKDEINLCSCPTCAAVAYSCAETAGVPRLVCPQ